MSSSIANPRPATPKGRRTRSHLVESAAALMHSQGVAATTLADVRAAARVSSSQLYHYFEDKQSLVRAVVEHQADVIVANEQARDLSSIAAFRRWRDEIVQEESTRQGQGGCPLGSLGANLAETDPDGRARVAAGFDRWSHAIEDGLARMQDRGDLPADVDVHRQAVGLLAAMQGGLLLGQLQRDAAPLRDALDCALDHLETLHRRAVGDA